MLCFTNSFCREICNKKLSENKPFRGKTQGRVFITNPSSIHLFQSLCSNLITTDVSSALLHSALPHSSSYGSIEGIWYEKSTRDR